MANKLEDKTKGKILIQGSASIVKMLIKGKLLDELWLLTNPYIGGSGKHLFEAKLNQQLVLIEEKTIENGVIISKYKLKY